VIEQALAQTENYLDKLGVIKEAMNDTAGAAQLIQKEGLMYVHHIPKTKTKNLQKRPSS
jgi:prephenate dehydratase